MIEEKIKILREILRIRIHEELELIRAKRNTYINDEGLAKVKKRVIKVFNDTLEKYVTFKIRANKETRNVWVDIGIDL